MRKGRLQPEPPHPKLLFTQTQLLDQGVVPLDVFLLEIGEQIATLVDHHQKAAARMVVFVVTLEVVSQVADALCEDRDLDFRTSGVALALGVIFDNFCFFFGGYRHIFSFLLSDIGKVETPDHLGPTA